MIDQIQIINLALAKLSDNNTVQNLMENSPEAMQARAHWDIALHALLSEHPWDFAKRQRRLAPLDEDTSLSPYEFHFAYPADCIHIRRVFPSGRTYDDVPYAIALSSNGSQSIIQCNHIDAAAEYTFATPPTTSFPVQFVSALAWRLAAEIALATGRPNAGDMLQAYSITLNEAKLRDARERGPRSQVDGGWLKSRYPAQQAQQQGQS
ncbi:MAG: hypothetical protein LUC93_04745 [Planctomycetaceae bacterium]|nr:hypothetical protein [Planctomycetaceae bacterium]